MCSDAGQESTVCVYLHTVGEPSAFFTLNSKTDLGHNGTGRGQVWSTESLWAMLNYFETHLLKQQNNPISHQRRKDLRRLCEALL